MLLRERPNYGHLRFGTLITQGGQWVLQVAIGWLMLDLTNSEFWVGLSGCAGGVPMLMLAVPAGIAADRFDRRTVLLSCQFGLCTVGVALTLLVAFGIAEPWILLLGACANGALMTVNNTARPTMLPATVNRAELPAAIAFSSAGQSAARTVGPSLAGVGIAPAGGAGAFVLQAALLGISLLLTLQVASPTAAERRVSTSRIRPAEGLRLVWRRRVLRGLVLLAAIPTLTVFPYIQFLSVYARDILGIGPQGLGLLLAMSGIGAVAGALLIANSSSIPRPGRFMVAATVAYCAIVVAFAVSSSIWISLPLLILAGVSGSAYLALNSTLLQLNVDDEVRGRVVGYRCSPGDSCLSARYRWGS